MAEQSTLPHTPCTGTRFDSQTSVFAGDSCGQVTCIDGNNDACCSQSLVVIQSNQDHACHVLAHGFGCVSGNFALQIIPTRLVGLSGLLASCKCSMHPSLLQDLSSLQHAARALWQSADGIVAVATRNLGIAHCAFSARQLADRWRIPSKLDQLSTPQQN